MKRILSLSCLFRLYWVMVRKFRNRSFQNPGALLFPLWILRTKPVETSLGHFPLQLAPEFVEACLTLLNHVKSCRRLMKLYYHNMKYIS